MVKRIDRLTVGEKVVSVSNAIKGFSDKPLIRALHPYMLFCLWSQFCYDKREKREPVRKVQVLLFVEWLNEYVN